MPELYVLVTAAGSSRRMGGGNKLLLPLGREPLLVRTVRVFDREPMVAAVAVSAPPDQVEEYRRLFREHGLQRVRWVVAGGAERQLSIHRTLEAMRLEDEDRIGIHDGARPLVSSGLVQRLVEHLDGWDGVLPMLPVKDTIKRVDAGGRVLETLTRSELYAAQTPQLFRYGTILSAHRAAAERGYLGTDDAALVEWQGGRVGRVEGEPSNIKVTTPDDLEYAETLLETLHGR